VNAAFQTLLGAAFTVGGAEPAADSALVSAGAEMRWANGFSLAANFEGEFANGNDKKAGLKAKQAFYIQQIKGRLTARHIAVIVLPAWRKIPGAVANRAWDDHYFAAKGHASIARYLLPKVMALLGRQHSSSR